MGLWSLVCLLVIMIFRFKVKSFLINYNLFIKERVFVLLCYLIRSGSIYFLRRYGGNCWEIDGCYFFKEVI